MNIGIGRFVCCNRKRNPQPATFFENWFLMWIVWVRVWRRQVHFLEWGCLLLLVGIISMFFVKINTFLLSEIGKTYRLFKKKCLELSIEFIIINICLLNEKYAQLVICYKKYHYFFVSLII